MHSDDCKVDEDEKILKSVEGLKRVKTLFANALDFNNWLLHKLTQEHVSRNSRKIAPCGKRMYAQMKIVTLKPSDTFLVHSLLGIFHNCM